MSDRLRDEARSTGERLFAASKHAPLRPGDRLGAYRVGRLLGLGGQAFVYEATHDALGRRVALKVPRPEVAERVLHERSSRPSLEHPNVVRVEDVGSAEVAAGDGREVPFLVMELCPAGAWTSSSSATRAGCRSPRCAGSPRRSSRRSPGPTPGASSTAT
jgi:serine/threonine protein kinase